jgi:hypothetical protein
LAGQKSPTPAKQDGGLWRPSAQPASVLDGL